MDKYNEIFLTTTDTVTGLGIPIVSKNKHMLYLLKKRSFKKPFIILLSSIAQAKQFDEFTSKTEELAKRVWPGAVTLVLSKQLALRIPANNGLRALIATLGPVYMTSANISGEKALSFSEAKKKFKQVTLHYNFGKGSGKSSTIIDVKTGKVIRK